MACVRWCVGAFVCMCACVRARARVLTRTTSCGAAIYASKYLCNVFPFIVYRHYVTQMPEHSPFFPFKCTLEIENGEHIFIFYYICMHMRMAVWGGVCV